MRLHGPGHCSMDLGQSNRARRRCSCTSPAVRSSTVLVGVYSQQLELQDDQLLDVLAVADFLGVAVIKDACSQVLSHNFIWLHLTTRPSRSPCSA